MFLEFIVPAAVVLFFSYNTLPLFKYGVDTNIQKTKELWNTNRSDKCLSNTTNHCLMSNYKQCTNNYKNHPKCNCKDQRSYETCQWENKVDIKNKYQSYEYQQKRKSINDKYAQRVNIYKVSTTKCN